jgi:hypothetical protein
MSMAQIRRSFALNRALLSQRPLDSRALTVLAALFHRFPEAGNYEAFLRRGERLLQRVNVQVMDANAPNQITIDLATVEEQVDDGDRKPYVLAVGGVLGFFVSAGTAAYTISINRLKRVSVREGRKEVLLDSAREIPAGDLFVVTLVRPGTYRAVNELNRAEMRIAVSLPRGERYRADQPSLVQSTQAGFDPKAVNTLAGRSLAFNCTAPAHIRVEMERPEEPPTQPPEGRPRRTVMNPKSKPGTG